ncbi:peptide/nickel transport system permease protein [Marinactinospora thermotolerans DSM 45154]|uniref:Peptide/nickel transport system permease protein n=1 Tax=Marinactinospora thermotolerans DSM 45154 TaxID=1122192 RepID=A0A1T4LLC0_9ACTN|nr:ABC transporter permease [Marinactinospora thermotolerans]SJZ55367.1 peptide/nickel transport system permease protein [Marinactinospora thermotolerans DSM 45154]
MAGFLLRRLGGGLLLVVVVSSCAYLLAASALDPRGNYEGRQPPLPEHVVDTLLERYNLSDRVPLAERYVTWAGNVLTGDLGRTWDGRPIGEEVERRAGVTLRLVVPGVLVGGVTGVLVGAWAGARRYGAVDRLSTVGAFLVISTPAIVIAVCLQNTALWVNDVAGTDLLRATGEYTHALPGDAWDAAVDRARHLVLPTLTIALPLAAVYSRYQRALMADQVGADHVRTARAKGLTRRSALLRHGLRPTLGSAFAYFGYSSAALFTGAVFTEKVFGWHGLGEFLLDSVAKGDVNAVAAVCALAAATLVAVGILADVARFLLDPRAREV